MGAGVLKNILGLIVKSYHCWSKCNKRCASPTEDRWDEHRQIGEKQVREDDKAKFCVGFWNFEANLWENVLEGWQRLTDKEGGGLCSAFFSCQCADGDTGWGKRAGGAVADPAVDDGEVHDAVLDLRGSKRSDMGPGEESEDSDDERFPGGGRASGGAKSDLERKRAKQALTSLASFMDLFGEESEGDDDSITSYASDLSSSSATEEAMSKFVDLMSQFQDSADLRRHDVLPQQ